MLVRQVIGQLELVEGDNFLHPLLPGSRTVGVDVHSLRHLGVRLPRDDPTAERKNLALILITASTSSSPSAHFLLEIEKQNQQKIRGLAVSPVVELVAEIVGSNDVEEQDVLRLRVKPRHSKLHLREHLPANVELG